MYSNANICPGISCSMRANSDVMFLLQKGIPTFMCLCERWSNAGTGVKSLETFSNTHITFSWLERALCIGICLINLTRTLITYEACFEWKQIRILWLGLYACIQECQLWPFFAALSFYSIPVYRIKSNWEVFHNPGSLFYSQQHWELFHSLT